MKPEKNVFVMCAFVSIFGLDTAQTTIDLFNVLEQLTNSLDIQLWCMDGHGPSNIKQHHCYHFRDTKVSKPVPR